MTRGRSASAWTAKIDALMADFNGVADHSRRDKVARELRHALHHSADVHLKAAVALVGEGELKASAQFATAYAEQADLLGIVEDHLARSN